MKASEILMLVGGQFDLEMNFIIQEQDSIVCMVELLDKCEPTCQAEVWSIFTAILKKSVRNLQACTDTALINLVLDRVAHTDSMIADLMVDMLGVLASYSITVKELKLFFSKLQGEKGQWPPHAVKLLSVLKSMAHRNGPDSFFSFPGKSAAAIALPPIAKWPYQNGFTFHTWLRMDPINNINWYMVTIVHVYNRWKNSEISCYVNGELASYGEITWFVNTSDTFDKCFLGSSETADANRVFCGQMGAVYLFGEALSAAQILAIYQLGPGHVQDVKAVVTHSVQSAIHSIGGVQVLFPLFAQLDHLQHTSDELDTSVCCTLLSFVMELLKNSVAMQEQVLACKGFLVIGYTLEKSSKVHVTRSVLDIVLAFARYLSNLQNGVLLLKQLCDHILVGTVLQVMHTLKYYYWVVNPQDRSGVTPKGLDGPRPNQKEIHSLRAFLLLFVKQLIMKDYGVKEDELQSILNYLLTMHEDDNLIDVLQLLVALMAIYKLLASNSEGIRVQALKVLGYFLKHLPAKRKSEVMLGHGLFSLLNERLMLHSNQFSMTTYNVLFEILTEQICTQVIHKQHPDPDSTVKILNPQVLKVIAALLKNSPLSPESMEVRRVFLSDMIKLFNNSKDNRRSLLQCSVWQDWMLSLCFINPKSSEEQKVTEMVYAIFRILLYHAIKYEWGGWRVWVDTLSITHSKVTFEQHKENLARMFHQYQRLGSEGDAAGIRTISGASRDSEILGQLRTNRDQGEETAPSTMIELTIDPEGVPQNQESPNTTPPSAASTTSASTPSPPEREGDRSQRGQAPITVSNMLARAEEEEEELQQVQNQISEDQSGGAGDRAETTTQETEAKLTEDKVSSKTIEAMTETETSTDKTDDAAAASTVETDEATKPETDDAKVAETETSDDAKTSGTDKVVKPQTDGEKGSKTHSNKAGDVLRSENTKKEPKEPELAKQPEEQVSAETLACQKGSVAEGSAVAGGASVRSVSDQVRPSSTDDSMEESSFVSAAGGEEGEKEAEEVKTKEVVVEEVKKEEVKAEEIKLEEVVVEEVKKEEVKAEEIKTEVVKTEKKKEEESVAVVTESAVESQETPPASVPEESQTQPPKMEEIDLDPSSPGTDPTSTEPAQQPLESTTSPPMALEAILPTPAAVGATVSKSDTPQAVAPAEAPSTKAVQPEASGATEAPSTRNDTSPKVATATAVEAGKDSAAEGPGSATKTKEIHIARLDVSSVASDTERLELKETTTPEAPQGQAAAAGASGGQARESSSSARSTMFRIPEFRWSHMHQRLLTDLLFSIETDVQMWRSHSTKTVMDFVNSSENVVFVHNTVHLISQVVDNLIMACGGILPLLSAATSSSHDLENIEPSQGLAVEASVTFLQRLINLVDVLVFASSLNFTEIEAEKNMSSGGILRQSLRLVCAMAVRNCLECQQHSHFKPSQDSARGQQALQSLMGAANKQAQFLALAVVYFISVLMVSKYRDILEPQNDKKHPQRSQSARSADSGAISGGPDLESSVSLRRRDSGIGDDHTSVAPSEADSTAQGPDAVSEALSTLSSEVRVHRDNPTADARGGKNVKDILRSLVSVPADDIMVDPSLLPPAFLGTAMGNNPNQFRSFDRSVRVAPKKVGGARSPGSSTPVQSAAAAVAAAGTPVNNVAVVSTGDASQRTTAEATAGESQTLEGRCPSSKVTMLQRQHVRAASKNTSAWKIYKSTVESAVKYSRYRTFKIQKVSHISERLEHALEKAAPLLREIFVDFAPFLSRTLLGSHGQELLIEGTSKDPCREHHGPHGYTQIKSNRPGSGVSPLMGVFGMSTATKQNGKLIDSCRRDERRGGVCVGGVVGGWVCLGVWGVVGGCVWECGGIVCVCVSIHMLVCVRAQTRGTEKAEVPFPLCI
ncbi:unnamed protein product [Coregonus sp. 'balchen']|nr:unnamed protein product [Coregonus sp. 'balchen']